MAALTALRQHASIHRAMMAGARPDITVGGKHRYRVIYVFRPRYNKKRSYCKVSGRRPHLVTLSHSLHPGVVLSVDRE